MTYEPKRRCEHCGQFKYVNDFYYAKCADCVVLCQKENDRKHYRGNRMRRLISNAQQRANRKGCEFDLDAHEDDLNMRLSKGLCELTGIRFNLENADRFAWDSPSIDRINPSLGYTYSNVRIVLYGINAALGHWGEEVFKQIAEAYLQNAI